MLTREQPDVPGSASWYRHTEHMSAVGFSLLFGSPWLVAIGWAWSRAPRSDAVPMSMAESARLRLWPNEGQ